MPVESNGASPPWQIEAMRLVNWGGFDEYHRIDFALAGEHSLGTTMITGESGCGKSTLLDAYIDVMMPSNTRFNSASNDVGRGRARGDQERTVLTYLQGKTDVVYDDELDVDRDQVLRDGSCARWSAIIVTFVNGKGGRFSAAKLYYLKPGCDSNDGYKVHLVTADRALDPRSLEAIAEKPFDKRSIKSVFDGACIHDSVGGYYQRIHTTLNIGSHGDGSNAMELLARIQSGYNITTVDELFKQLVLDRPRTYEEADHALDHFDDIDEAYREIEDARSKMDVLATIVEDKKRYDEEQGKAELIASLGTADDRPDAFFVWRIGWESERLGQAILRNEVEKADNERLLEEMTGKIDVLDGEIAQTERELHENGDDAVKVLDARIAVLEKQKDRRLGSRALFVDKTSPFFDAPASQSSYDSLSEEAESFLASFEADSKQLQIERDDLTVERRGVENRIAELRSEAEYLRSHRGNIPRYLNEAREEIASVTGLGLDDLPFVGELIDIKPEEDKWRLAAETTLHALARTMLVDKDQLDRVSHLIDSLKLRTRIHFQGVKASDLEHVNVMDGGVASKLIFNDESRFAPWIRKKTASSSIDALCVDHPSKLLGDGLRVTANGQTRSGSRGAHGRNPREQYVIGFDNRRRFEEVKGELQKAAERLSVLAAQLAALESSQSELAGKRDACLYISGHAFEEIDVEGVKRELETCNQERTRLLRSNDVLRDLREKSKELANQRETLANERAVLSNDNEKLSIRLEAWTKRKSVCDAGKRQLEDQSEIQLGAGQAELLDRVAQDVCDRYEDPDAPLLLFDSFIAKVWNDVAEMRASAETNARASKSALEKTFRMYNNRWHDNDRGTSIDSYDDYREILETIQAEGLYDRTEEWLESMHQWVAEDLVPLLDAYESAIREIEDRLEPINEILDGFQFGAAKGRLVIEMRRKTSASAERFRRDLQKYASLATSGERDSVEARRRELVAFMARLRKGSEGGTGERDELLDRRRQVTITAKAQWPENAGKPDSVYRQLGEKSGGEVQELIAFILGAALLFCLGSETLGKPSFAPVMLDEGFIKADSKFTQRAIKAWSGFGFQVIIATPHGKVESLIDCMERYVTITKDGQERSYIAQATTEQGSC